MCGVFGCAPKKLPEDTKTYRFDLIIANGTILDGSGGEPFVGDVGIRGDRIVAVGDLDESTGRKVIDAAKQFVMPGIIDVHNHADRELLRMPAATNLIHQGITTLVTGNCGGAAMPVSEFFSDLETEGIALNVAHLLGHNTVRRKVMGMEARPPSENELAEMKNLVEQAMKDGAVGMSTGLKYTPGVWADTSEVIELSKVVAKYGGVYASHMRDEGRGIIESVEETIEIGRKAGLPVQISHHKVASTDKWGASKKTLELVDEANRQGIEVMVDQYPYPATSTGMTVLFPPWSLEGGRESLVARLADDATRTKIRAGIVDNIIHDRGGGDPANIQIANCKSRPGIEGKNLAQILDELGREKTPEEAAELAMEIQEEGGASVIYHCLADEDIERILQHPVTMVATDSHIVMKGRGSPHPRNYGTFPRVFRLYVKEKGILTYAEAVRKMTALPAKQFRLKGRGRIAPSMFADVVIFDPESIADTSTWLDPHNYPTGISMVIVNGTIEATNGKQLDTRSGRVLKH